MTAELVLIETESLSPIEGFGPKRVEWLKEKIANERIWTVPLKVERTRRLIMDGHHRFQVARLLGLKRVPAQLYSYDEVELYSLRKGTAVTSDIIFANADKGIIFPYKTAKHNFPVSGEVFSGVSLDELT